MPYAAATPNPAAFAGISSDALKNVAFTYHDLPPYLEKALRPNYTERANFADTLKYMGYTRGVDTAQVGHYEIPRPYSNVKIGSIVTASTGAGTPVVARLHSTSVTLSNNKIGGVAQYTAWVRVTDQIILADGNLALVKSMTKSGANIDITLVPMASTVDLASKVVVNGEYPIGSSSHAVASGQIEGLNRATRKWSNDFQIIKESSRNNGTELTHTLYNVTIDGKAGNIKEVILDDLMDEVYKRKRAYALLTGQQNTNTTVAYETINYDGYNQDSPYTGTQGFLSFVETGAHALPTNFASLDITDFDDVGKHFENERVGQKSYMLWGSYDLNTSFENVLLNRFDKRSDQYLVKNSQFDKLKSMMGDKFAYHTVDEFLVDIGFKGVRKGSYNYTFCMMHEFNDLKGLGAHTKYAQYGIFAPMGFTQDSVDNTKMLPLFGYQYKQKGKYNRESIFGSYGGIGVTEVPSNGYDIATQGMLCEIAGHFYCENQYVLMTGV